MKDENGEERVCEWCGKPATCMNHDIMEVIDDEGIQIDFWKTGNHYYCKEHAGIRRHALTGYIPPERLLQILDGYAYRERENGLDYTPSPNAVFALYKTIDNCVRGLSSERLKEPVHLPDNFSLNMACGRLKSILASLPPGCPSDSRLMLLLCQVRQWCLEKFLHNDKASEWYLRKPCHNEQLSADAICEVCGKVLAHKGATLDCEFKNYVLGRETIQVVDQKGEIIFRSLGEKHCFCPEHAPNCILTVTKRHVTLSQLAECLSLQNWDLVEADSLRYTWIKRILQNCLEGMQ